MHCAVEIDPRNVRVADVRLQLRFIISRRRRCDIDERRRCLRGFDIVDDEAARSTELSTCHAHPEPDHDDEQHSDEQHNDHAGDVGWHGHCDLQPSWGTTRFHRRSIPRNPPGHAAR